MPGGAALGGLLGGAVSGGLGFLGAKKSADAQEDAAQAQLELQAEMFERMNELQQSLYEQQGETIDKGTRWSADATENAWKTTYQTANELRNRGEALAGETRDKNVGLFEPTRQLGDNALKAYAYNLGVGERPGDYAMEMTPATRYLMEQGRDVTEGGAAGAGGLYSGATLEALEKMRTGLAAQDRGQQQGELFALGGMGQQAAGQVANANNAYNANMYGIGTDWGNALMGGSDRRTDRLIGIAQGRTDDLGTARTNRANLFGSAAGQYAQGAGNAYANLGSAQSQGALGSTNALLGGLQTGFGLYGMLGGKFGQGNPATGTNFLSGLY